jgi:hypothetical protein
MGNILKRLWHPTKMDVLGARYFFGFLCPFILAIIVFLPSLVILAGILMIAAFATRVVIVARAASTLPVDDDLIEKYRSVTPQKRRTHRYFSLFLPLVGLVMLVVAPKYLYVGFGIMVFFGLATMSYADLPTWLLVPLSSLYVLAPLTISGLQAGYGAVLMCLLAAVFVYPETLAVFLALNKFAASGLTANHSLQSDGANSSVGIPD